MADNIDETLRRFCDIYVYHCKASLLRILYSNSFGFAQNKTNLGKEKKADKETRICISLDVSSTCPSPWMKQCFLFS